MTQINGFVIVEKEYRYNDETYEDYGIGGVPKAIYTDKEEADEVCKKLNEERRFADSRITKGLGRPHPMLSWEDLDRFHDVADELAVDEVWELDEDECLKFLNLINKTYFVVREA